MATGTLTIQVKTALTLDGANYDTDNTTTIPNVTNVMPLQKTIPSASEIEILKIGTSGVAGELDNIRAFHIVNKDSTNFVRIRLLKAGADTADFKIEAGSQMIFNNSDLSVDAAAGAFAAFVQFDTILCQADTADVDIEATAYQV